MKIYEGNTVFNGIAIGNISLYKKRKNLVKREYCQDIVRERERFKWAVEVACEQLGELHEKALIEVGEASAAIFEAHQMLLRDYEFVQAVCHIIDTQNVNAEYAVQCTGENYAAMFQAMDDDYMCERSVDIKDVSNRVIDILCGVQIKTTTDEEQSVIVVADDLTPSETIQFDKTKVIALVTRRGSANSHTAILAKTMNIPALINVDFEEYIDGKMAIVDGYTGRLIVEPEEEMFNQLKNRQTQDARRRQLLMELKGKDNVTQDGRRIDIYANISGVSDVMNVLKYDAGGIGLFRSEFLYLGARDYPTEDEQFMTYKAVAESMAGRKVIIRTLDIGADKQVEYFGLQREENPAMGLRGIRLCLKMHDIFKTQLRAILRASVYGNISVMFPMIISVSEIKRIKLILEEVMTELDREQVPYRNIETGIMIETPAAALISEELAKEVDFFSIGTNDLTQYTLAIDRQNEELSEFYDAHHNAVMKLIKMVVDNGHEHNCSVGICGELAADLTLTETFINMGIDELSVPPLSVLEIRDKIRSL